MALDPFKMDKLTISLLSTAGGPLVLQWRGEVSSRDPGQVLTPYFSSLFGEKPDLTKVVFDFSGLDFMNSSILVPIVAFITEAGKRSVKVELRYNSEVSWQRVSQQCMNIMCKKLNHVEVTCK